MSRLSADEQKELRAIHVHAGRRVDSLFAGDWRSAVRGQGMEFEEVRPYSAGDDVRHLDWNVTARAGEPFVKVFREERQLTVLLAVDVSGSTRVGSGGADGRTDRRLQIARVAGGIAYAGVRNRDQVGLFTFSDRPEVWLSPKRTRGHVWTVIQRIFEGRASAPGTDVGAAARYLMNMQRRRAVIVFVSDFLDRKDWGPAFGALCSRHQVHAVVVGDPLDERPPLRGLFETYDAETGRVRLVDGATIAPAPSLHERLTAVRRLGAKGLALRTDEDAFVALHQHFRAQARRR